MPPDNKADLDVLKSQLAERAEALCLVLFGEPKSRTSREWRWGNKGSLSVRFGLKKGWPFYSYELLQGGSFLDAIMFAQQCDFAGAVAWTREWLGETASRQPPRNVPSRPSFDAEQDEAERVASAGRIWRAARSAAGTSAGRYLAARGITTFPTNAVRFAGGEQLHSELRWWPREYGAMIVPATSASGDVRAVQLVAIDDDGKPHRDEDGNKYKRSRGSLIGAAVRFCGRDTGPLFLAEGPETALSIWLASGCETWANVGSVARAPLDGVPERRLVVVCRDDDPPQSPAFVARRNAVRSWRKAGRTVVEATPWELPRGDKSDFADVLSGTGEAAVLARLDAAIAPLLAAQEERPSVEEARADLRKDIVGAVSHLLAWRDDGQSAPPFLAAVVDVGIGKTELALLEAALKAYRAGRKPVYTTPTHALNGELVIRLEAMAREQNLSPLVAVYRGAEAQDPANPGKTMCTEPALYSSATAAHVSPLDSVCKICPSRETCAFLRQQGMVADIWFAAVDVIFRAPPRPLRDVDFLVIDEGFVQRGMFGISAPLQLVDRSMFNAASDSQIEHGSGRAADTADLIQELRQFRRALGKLLDGGGIGPLEREAIAAARLNKELCQQAVNLEWKRFRQVPRGEMDADQTDNFLKSAATNANVKIMIRLWTALADLAADDGPDRSGRVSRWASDNGKIPDCFRVVGRDRIDKAWRVPTLHIDASADMSLIRERVGSRAKLAASATAATPHMHVTQLTGAFGKGALLEGTGRHLVRIWSWTLATARETGGEWLVIANKAVVAKLAEMGPPEFVKFAHFNALRGLDAYGQVRGIVVLGRPMPAPGAVETLRGAITGRATPHALAGYYPLVTTTIRGRDGSAVSVYAETHPDPLVDALLRSISDAEIIQAVGRGRGVNRDVDRPLAVYVLGNTPLQAMQPDHVEQWEPLGSDREHFARAGIELESAADMARLMGEPDRKKIEKARSRGQMPTNASNRYSIENVGIWNSGTRVGAYQVKQPRKSASLRYARVSADAGALLPHLQKIFPASAITAVHDPWASGLGIVQCQRTGQLNFGLAPININ